MAAFNLLDMNPWAILLAAVSAFVVGGLWYSDRLFGRRWAELSGVDEQAQASHLIRTFLGSFVLALLVAAVLSLYVGLSGSARLGLIGGLIVSLAWVAPALGITYLFERRPLAYFAINGGYHVVAFALMGGILGAFGARTPDVASAPPAESPAHVAAAPAPRGLAPLVHEVTLDVPPDRAWQLFTTSEGIESWMAPQALVDLRVGGTVQTHYAPGGRLGDENTLVSEILSYEPQRMLSLRNVRSPANAQLGDALRGAWSVTYFEPRDGDRTHVRMVGLGYPDTPQARAAYRFFERANEQLLTGLQQGVQREEDAGPSGP